VRIISGKFKGRKLAVLKGTHTRPTSDRVREALFNILGATPEDAMVLDLFAGTGALGIEALSRGARGAVFVDSDRLPLDTLHRNITSCQLQACTHVFRWDIAKNLHCIKSLAFKFDLVFLDPPYHHNLIPPTLDHLLEMNALTPKAIVVAEHAADECPDPPLNLSCERRRTYGQTQLSFFTPTINKQDG
jgi:16S rRNA (guanine966-N2)-methyltransferase